MQRPLRRKALLAALPAATLLAGSPCQGQPLEPLLGLDAYMAVPPENPLGKERVALGRRLFFDERLSADRSLSCATCHEPERAFTDSRPVAVGVFGRKGARRVPKLVNRGFGTSFFWDGRDETLEEQVFKPILNPLEMALTEDAAVERVRSDPGYARAFRSAFGSEPDRRTIAFALASFVRTIRSGSSPYDRHMAGQAGALAPRQRSGLRIFRGKANCGACHVGPNLTDEGFHNTGVGWGEAEADEGRYAVTGRAADRGAFKTPTLREAAGTGPYMHDGSLATLSEVVDFYDEGGRPNPYLDPEIAPLGLTDAEKADLLEFLRSLSGRVATGL